jgi:hypothetical protein
MKILLSERNIVVALFIMVFVIFSMAHEDSKKMEQGYIGANSFAAHNIADLSTTPLQDIPKTASLSAKLAQ